MIEKTVLSDAVLVALLRLGVAACLILLVARSFLLYRDVEAENHALLKQLTIMCDADRRDNLPRRPSFRRMLIKKEKPEIIVLD